MSAETVFTAMDALLIPDAIPAANRHVWWPESFNAYPALVYSLNKPSVERRVANGKKQQYHWIEIDLLLPTKLAGGQQNAVVKIRTWVKAIREAIHTNRQLTVDGVEQVRVCGEMPNGEGIEDFAGIETLSQNAGDVLARGFMVIPVQDNWEDG